MRLRQSKHSRRHGVAAVEFAFVLPLLLLLMIGIWEVGRIIHVQITLNNAVRDGARIGAQANIVNTNGAYTQIRFDTGTPNIQDAIKAFLRAGGISDHTGLQIQFEYMEGTGTGSTTANPYTGVKNQRFRVRVILPYDNVRWTTLSLVNPSTLRAETYWQCLVDDPFTLNVTLPGWTP